MKKLSQPTFVKNATYQQRTRVKYVKMEIFAENWNNLTYGNSVSKIFNSSVVTNFTKKNGLTSKVIFP